MKVFHLNRWNHSTVHWPTRTPTVW